ncbi:putative phage-like protein YoqJ [Salirhabdus euzebyi]|uniref:UPF0398 protein HNQ94_000695 n=1 Tax=Salirhabdus euzebyi TaxID=394506 RepID=A0A841PTX3_9BACI|nr:DUF1273 domain-containing protein [Salirhabdus euzebyi]MBB6452250.1 putative phage-like protein YoqJ [Salirhabdus euzebyi]
MNVLTITGYKPMELGIFNSNDKRIPYIKETIKRRLLPLIEDGIEWILISGQAGVELWAAEVVLELQLEYDIKLAVIPPFTNQEQRWKEDLQLVYQEIVEQADFYEPLVKKEYEGPHQFKIKDKWLIQKSDACLILYEPENEGTPKFFLEEVKRQNKPNFQLFYITSFDLDDTFRDMELNSSNFIE